MLTLKKSHQLLIGVILAALLIVTRGHHFASISHLPSASWAVFFLAGVYLRPAWVFAGLLALAAGLDIAAVTWGGVSNFCVSPAYPFLLPAYGALWLAGRWLAAHYRFAWSTLATAVGSLFVSTVAAELFSSGGFYFFSGRYADPTLVEFGHRFAKYYPSAVSNILLYVGIAAIIHILVKAVRANGKLTSA
ncbi:MAG TPA: hypothetical protein VFF74_07805 [Methylophilaceae bacterium]|nr:hypothetical protein [Methylophilaceae bacterium]